MMEQYRSMTIDRRLEELGKLRQLQLLYRGNGTPTSDPKMQNVTDNIKLLYDLMPGNDTGTGSNGSASL